jgi:DNA mismatch repair protein MutS
VSAADTPMFHQYRELKARNPDAILFFRMGDFYEVFFDDALLCARLLDIALTSRNKGDTDEIPMAGVPYHAVANYLQKLGEGGHKVAIAEQVEDPAQAKGLVRRDIVRVVTPGVVYDPSLIEAREPNHLVAVVRGPGGIGVAFLDATTGDFRCTTVEVLAAAAAEIHRFEPREALLGPGLEGERELLAALARHNAPVARVDVALFAKADAGRALRACLPDLDFSAIGLDLADGAALAAGALVQYAQDMQGSKLSTVHQIHVYRTAGYMVIDETSRKNLEIARTLLGGRRQGSLVGLLDQTATAMGSRALKRWLAFPLLDRAAISTRQRAIGALLDDPTARDIARRRLRDVADIERLAARIGTGAGHARDLAMLRRSLQAVPDVLAAVAHLTDLAAVLPRDPLTDVAAYLQTWIVDDPPVVLTEGGMIRRGASAELDEVTDLANDGEAAIARLEDAEREATGISSLKIRRNKVFDFYIEISKANLHKVPGRYLRKQTLSTGERYMTPELKDLEERVLGADHRRKLLENRLFLEVRAAVSAESARLMALAAGLAEIDVLVALAEVASRGGWVRPELDETGDLDLRGARHPVLEALRTDERFVPNDCALSTDLRRLVVLTGPNMAGKSTWLRQVALCVLLAQIGSFVPAESARIGICDRIFTRVGAADDLARGQSTFMVEMSETAAILHHATARSLVVLDEIGRGTSTYDGLAIAWAVAEDLVDRVRCRALFATHYHELCQLAEIRDVVANQSVAVSESGDQIVFLRKIKEGGASRSYGIQCARLAGLPDGVVERARSLLQRFEKGAPRDEYQQLSLFGPGASPARESGVTQAPAPAAPPTEDPLRAAVREIDPDTLTPREALEALYRLRRWLTA